ncbi:MAG TPA: PQQ-binding-like beta-propeller repeat protein [Planctomycetaceae bacterium]|nr:PQQ-binding-like beta-propeller repeat protein [Planctomycetaceae bacterium]
MRGQGIGQPPGDLQAERPPSWRQICSRIAVGLIALLSLVPAVSEAQSPFDADSDLPITVNPPRERLRAMYEAATFAEREQYPAAAKALQSVLESPEDYFVEHDLKSTLKQQAISLLASWPRAGREAYERLYSSDASVQWERVQRAGAWSDWSMLLSQYWMTPAGRAAADQWAVQSVDAGDALWAGRYWQQLRETHGGREKDLSAGLREALAWELAGRADLRQARLALFGLEAPPQPVVLGGRTFAGAKALDDAAEWIGNQIDTHDQERSQRMAATWNAARGDNARNAVALPAGPIGQPLWSASLLDELCEPLLSEPNPHRRAMVRQSVVQLEERLTSEDRIALPATIPVVNRDRVVIRTLSGLAAFDLATGALKWRSALDGSQFRRQWNQLPKELADPAVASAASPALQQFLRERLYRDSLQGTIACNEQIVFAIESNLEVAVPTPRNVIRGMPEVPDPVNRLTAFDLQNGQLLWEIGGPRGDDELPLAGHFFLGPPLVMGDMLYCLTESDSELRLLQLQVDSVTGAVALVWSQVLVAPDQPVSVTALRRVSGLTPTWAEGLLLCPTGCGILAAVDPLRKQLAWGFQYESQEPRPLTQRTLMMRPGNAARMSMPFRPDEELSRWIDAAPVFARGLVLFTPRDSAELICLDAVTGEVRWRRPRGSSLMVAGVQDDRVIVVGRSAVESLRLSDGEPVWTLATPMPVGQGLLLSQRYLLPVTGQRVLTIDLKQGRVLLHSQLDPAQGVGNLVAAGGSLLSASTTGISCFTPITKLETELERRFLADANDPAATALRGELRLHRGEQAAGLSDLRTALQRRPDAHTAAVLAHALLDGLRTDFAQFRTQAAELDRLLADSPVRSEFLRTYAQALADAGEPVAAFTEYLKLAELPDYEEHLERVSGGWSARGDRVVRGQVRTLYQSATPKERQAIDQAFAAFIARPATEGDVAARDRRVLRFFDALPLLDPVRLAVLSQNDDEAKSLKPLLARQLSRSSRPEYAAAGTAWIAQALLDQQRPGELAPWLDRLNGELASTSITVAEGAPTVTGRDLAAKLQAQWNQPAAGETWGDAEIVVERKARTASSARRVPVEVRGPVPPTWRDWTFEVTDAPLTVLTARDPDGHVRWKVDVAQQSTPNPFPRFGTQALFHTLHITHDRMVLGLTGRFAVLDLSAGPTPVVRWQTDLTSRGDPTAGTMIVNPRVDWLACGRRRVLPTTMSDLSETTPAGQVLGATDEFVCYTAGGRLIAAEIATGRVLWVRLGVPVIVEGTATADAVTLLDVPRAQATTYRPEDGAELSRRQIPEPETWLWFEGDRLLTVEVEETGTVTARLQQLITDTVLWERMKLPVGTRFSVPVDGALFQWSPPGQLIKLNLNDGAVRWTGKTPGVDEANLLRSERFGDLDLLFLGRTALTLESTRISVFDQNHLPFTGHVLGLGARSGEQRWIANILPTAIDQQARPNFPILPFVARQIDLARPANGPIVPAVPQMRFVATFLDKRTGDVLFKSGETAQPQQYQLELDEQRPRAVVSFSSWALELKKSP